MKKFMTKYVCDWTVFPPKEKYVEFNTDEIARLMHKGTFDEWQECWFRDNPQKTFYIRETKQWKDGTIRKQMIELNNAEETQKKVMQEKKMAAQKQNDNAANILIAIIFAPIFLIVIIAWLMGAGAGSSGSGMTRSNQEYWDSRSQEEKIEILSDYYEETNPNW